MSSIYQPTMNLRWREADTYEDEEQPCARNARGYTEQNYILQQQWASDAGKTEWRDIEIEKIAARIIPSDIKVTLIVCLSHEPASASCPIMTGEYNVLAELPGKMDAALFRPMYEGPKTRVDVPTEGYLYLIYRVDSPAYNHPLYFRSEDSDGRYVGKEDQVFVE